MKTVAITLACLLVAGAASADQKIDAGPSSVLGTSLDCTTATPVTCGDVADGTAGPNGGNVANYGCTSLSYDGSTEAVYEVCVATDTFLSVDMLYAHDGATNDLDLFLLGSCSEGDCLDASTGTSGSENVSGNVAAGTYYVVVDGWNGLADGSAHTLTVTCDAPCDPVSVDAASWGDVKALYHE